MIFVSTIEQKIKIPFTPKTSRLQCSYSGVKSKKVGTIVLPSFSCKLGPGGQMEEYIHTEHPYLQIAALHSSQEAPMLNIVPTV